MSDDDVYRLGSLDAGLRLLTLLRDTDRLSIDRAAAEIGSSRSTAHRLLRTLSGRGFAMLSGSGRGYLPGPELLRASAASAITAETRIRLQPVIDDLRTSTGESVHSAVLTGDHVLVVNGRRSSHATDIGLRIGMTAPAHAMAAGKLLLAALDDAQVRALLPADPLPRRGPETITSRELLLAELAVVRRADRARAHEESERGVHSLALPLDGRDWRSRLAVVLSVPTERASERHLSDLEGAVRMRLAEHAAAGTIAPWSFRATRGARSPRPATRPTN